MSIDIDKAVDANGNEYPISRPTFSSISEVLKRLPNRGVGAIWGRSIYEEYASYSAQNGAGHLTYGSAVVAGASFSLRRHAAVRSNLYARVRYKVESFLIHKAPAKPILDLGHGGRIEFSDIFDFAAAATWQQLVQLIKPRYISTRRVKEGIEHDVESYLSPFRNAKLLGDVIVNWRNGTPTYEDLILLWMFYHGERTSKFLIISDVKPKWIESSSVIYATERSYINVNEFIQQTARYLNKPVNAVNEAFSLWQRGVDPALRVLIKRGNLTETNADQFLLAYSSIISEHDELGISIILPKQQPAPLRFSASGNLIDIADERELPVGDPRVIGGATACISAVEDLKYYGGFANAVPGFETRCNRLIGLLEKLRTGLYDDNIVVQLGVEAQRLEIRLSAAGDMVSEDAMAEVSACIPLLQGLLSQFEIWSSYKSKSMDLGSEDAPQAAVDVLTSVRVRNDVLTGRAKTRVEDYVESVAIDGAESDINPRIVVENMAAQAATFIAKNAKSRKTRVSKELVEELSKDDIPGPARWLIDSADDLEAFAKDSKVSWLGTFLKAIKVQLH